MILQVIVLENEELDVVVVVVAVVGQTVGSISSKTLAYVNYYNNNYYYY